MVEGSGGVQVLEDEAGEPPSEQEIKEYGEFIGIDPEKEPDLLYIAAEGVSAPVPKPWKACSDADGEIFYFNFETEESVWDHPLDDHYKQMVIDARAKKAAGGFATGTSPGSGAGSPAAKATAKKSIPEADESDEVSEDIPSGSDDGSDGVSGPTSGPASPANASKKSDASPAASPAPSPKASSAASPVPSPKAAGGSDAKSPGVSPTAGVKLAPLKATGTLAPLGVTPGIKAGSPVGLGKEKKEELDVKSDDGSDWDSNASPAASPSGKSKELSISGAASPSGKSKELSISGAASPSGKSKEFSISGGPSPDPSPSASKTAESIKGGVISPSPSPTGMKPDTSLAGDDAGENALKAQVDALEKILEGLKDIRLKQAMYLQRLRWGPSGVQSG